MTCDQETELSSETASSSGLGIYSDYQVLLS